MSTRKPKIKALALRIPVGLHRKVKSEAVRIDRSVNATLELLIKQGLKTVLSTPREPATTADEWPSPDNPQPITEEPENFK